MAQYLIKDLKELCQVNYEKTCEAQLRDKEITSASEKVNKIVFDNSASMLQRSAYLLYPIVKELCARLVGETTPMN